MIDSNRIMELVYALEARGISTCDIELADGEALRLRFALPQPGENSGSCPDAATPGSQVAPPQSTAIESDGMGHFFRHHPLGDPADTFIAGSVGKGDIVGYLLIGETVQPVVSPVAGRLTVQLVPDGQLVGYGDALYSLEPLA